MNDETKKFFNEVTLINVFTPKEGKAEEFARAQATDFESFGERLDGAFENSLYISVNGDNKPRVINVARFESLEVFYRSTNSEEFKQHIETIRPLLDQGEPMLCQLVWQSKKCSDNDLDRALLEFFPKQVAENRSLSDRFGKRELKKSA